AIMGKDQPAGKYTLKWTIHDVYGKTSASREYAFELLPVGYGVIQALSPAFGVPGSQHVVRFGVVELPLDKTGKPKVDITWTIRASGGKPVSKPFVTKYPEQPLPPKVDLKELNVLPVDHLIYLNRPGNFTIDVEINEKLSPKSPKIKMSFPLQVL